MLWQAFQPTLSFWVYGQFEVVFRTENGLYRILVTIICPKVILGLDIYQNCTWFILNLLNMVIIDVLFEI